ncbi:MAG: hypothetical protein M3O50_21430 [Myxococcota bacterium]|nr:hypothetical protein [Myxococcota bacterium]
MTESELLALIRHLHDLHEALTYRRLRAGREAYLCAIRLVVNALAARRGGR